MNNTDEKKELASKDNIISPDYVICFYYDKTLKESLEQFKNLIMRLSEAGLDIEYLNGSIGSLFLFIRCCSARLQTAALVSRHRDWLYGVKSGLPDLYIDKKISSSERLKFIHDIITFPASEGGAGIYPDLNEWKMVKYIFPPHDRIFNRNYIYKIFKKGFISESDLDDIRNHFGEKIAIYFSFIRFYLLCLIFPIVTGFFAHFFLPKYSIIYAIIVNLWCILFIQKWRKIEVRLSIRWGVYGISKIYQKHRRFVGDEIGIYMTTRKNALVSSFWKKIFRKIFFMVFQVVLVTGVVFILIGFFFVDLYFSEIYDGPFQKYLVFIPTIFLAGFVSVFSTLYNKISTYINYYEDYETDIDLESAFIHKIFVINFIICYTALFLISCFYVPFGYYIIPRINIIGIQSIFLTSESIKIKPFVMNPDKLRRQFIYYMITGQVINFFKQWILPFVFKFFFVILERICNIRTSKFTHKNINNYSEKNELLSKVCREAELPEFPLLNNYLELVMQFGYISLFSIIWPLGSVCIFINNVVKVVLDFIRLFFATKRSIPYRTDTIGLWYSKLMFLSWLGSIVMSILIYFHKYFPNDKFFVEILVLLVFVDYLYRIVFNICKKVTRFTQYENLHVLKDEYVLRDAYLAKLMDYLPKDFQNDSQARHNYTKVIETGTTIIMNSFEKYKKA
ncbi:uncharacterized protein T551_01916 [Pneumocystis jirovecii RU7]|uniref:Anoctamin dimerisation domain-containing protein n=1 Tax=Pneumocystis jirovecii (strain RU7) TaxID=1408657 RepID=A0A0W4ZNM1_PNEJ7|nr:uncharacterized protein T551_01916 [Pneumocystis jirovecii RU7]KTW29972.1 hypothetical protein T551_01916 [Pneumocystis jirovecii RU7]